MRVGFGGVSHTQGSLCLWGAPGHPVHLSFYPSCALRLLANPLPARRNLLLHLRPSLCLSSGSSFPFKHPRSTCHPSTSPSELSKAVARFCHPLALKCPCSQRPFLLRWGPVGVPLLSLPGALTLWRGLCSSLPPSSGFCHPRGSRAVSWLLCPSCLVP